MLTLGLSAVSWIEHYLVHGPGDVQGQPIDLDDEFAGFLLKAYALDRRGQRRVRRAFLSRSKGRSKSGFAAMIECFEALGPCRFDHWAVAGEVSDWGYEYDEGEPVGKPLGYVEILNVATEESQAGNTYDAVHFMLHEETCSRALRLRYGRIDVGLTRINLPNKRGFIEPVTAANESKDGGKSTFIVADETHLWIPPAKGKFKLGKMHQTMVRNLLKRKLASGWMLETSTMYAEGEASVAEGTHAYARELAKAGRSDGKLLFDHRQAGESWDLAKRKERLAALREAYGPAAAWMDLDAIADYWDDPQATHAEFRRFWLNQPVPLETPVVEDGIFGPEWDTLPTFDVEESFTTPVLAVASTRGRTHTCISAAEKVGGLYRGKPIAHGRGSTWVLDDLEELSAERPGLVVVIDGKGPASALVEPLREAGVSVVEVGLNEAIAAADLTTQLVEDQELARPADMQILDDAEQSAKWRDVGDRRLFARKGAHDITPLESLALALWGTDNAANSTDAWGFHS